MKKISIGHLSHGKTQTGGFLFEQRMLESLATYYKQQGFLPHVVTERTNRYYNGLAHFKLMWWSFINARYDINIVVSRCALSAIARNLFTQRKVVVVLHNFDENDGKNKMLKVYFNCLFWFLKTISSTRISIVTGASFWVNYFEEKVNRNVPVFLFPNLFDNSKYSTYTQAVKQKQIYLGQFSIKNNTQIFELAKQLTLNGYRCYFTSLFKEEQASLADYEVSYVPTPEYLQDMASSEYTVAFIGINEGWNRVAHESILVGTQLIGVNKGGLGNLLMESNSFTAESVEEFLAIILNHKTQKVSPSFLQQYDIHNAHAWVQPLATFCITQ